MHRRFGRGAARLSLGTPIETESLSTTARAPIAGERLGSLTPGLACLALAVLVGSLASVATTPPDALEAPTVLVADAWDVPPDPIVAPKPRPIAKSEPIPAPDVRADASPPPALEAEPETTIPFDPRALAATRAPSIPELTTQPVPTRAAATRPGGLPTARALADLALAVPRSPRAGSMPDSGPDTPRIIPDVTRKNARPTARNEAATVATPAWDAMNDRRAFLAGLDADATAIPVQGARDRALPAVATSSNAAALTVREAALDQLRSEGWEAVPLEDLPDCHPAGRQDELKRRIMLAAADRPTCTHGEGAYRFLETRNLNAFLMGARNHDTPKRATSGPRNACEVLERALRCLEGTPSKEIETR